MRKDTETSVAMSLASDELVCFVCPRQEGNFDSSLFSRRERVVDARREGDRGSKWIGARVEARG